MATRDEPPDPQEVLAAAEAAHLAARRTVRISRSRAGARRLDPADHARETVRLDRADPLPPDREAAARRRPAVDRPDPAGPAGPAPRPAGATAGGDSRSRAPLALAAGVATGWAALISLVPVALFVTLLQAAETGPLAVGGTVRVAAAGWLLAHGVPVQTPDGPIGLTPLALSALAAWRVARAGVHVTRAVGARGSGSPRRALLVAAAVAVAYGGTGALVALVAGGPGWGASAPEAAARLAGFGLVAAGYGALRATGVLAAWAGRLPRAVVDGVRAGVVAAVLVLAAGAALAGVAVAGSGGAAADIIAAYRTNVAGQAGLTLLCLAYAPNLTGWAAAYLVGPGFAVGADTVVRSSEVVVGPLPWVPVFAGLPDGPLPTVGAVLLAVPVAAGAAAGWLVVRAALDRAGPAAGGATATPPAARGEDPPDRPPVRRPPVPWTRLVVGVVGSGVVAGGLLGLVAAVSAGPLGGGQLAAFGPEPVPVTAFSAATTTLGALLGAATAGLVHYGLLHRHD